MTGWCDNFESGGRTVTSVSGAGQANVTLVAHGDDAARFALKYATDRPRVVTSLVLVNPQEVANGVGPEPLRDFVSGLAASTITSVAGASEVLLDQMVSLWSSFLRRTRGINGGSALVDKLVLRYRILTEYQRSENRDCRKIIPADLPMVLICGEQDSGCSREAYSALAASGRATFLTGVGAWPHLEDPVKFVDALCLT